MMNMSLESKDSGDTSTTRHSVAMFPKFGDKEVPTNPQRNYKTGRNVSKL